MDWVGALRATTAQLSEEVARDVEAYVLDGGDDGVLGLVTYHDSAKMGMHAYNLGDHPARDIYVHFTAAPPGALIRWGQVLDAAESRPFRSHDLHVDRVYWPGTMLAHVGLLFPEGDPPFDFFDFAGLLAEADVHSGRLLVHAWQTGPHRYRREEHALPSVTLARLGRYGHAVDQMHTWLSPLLVTGDVEHRLHALDMLAPVSDGVLVTYAEQVAEAAVSGSAQVRERAAPLVARTGTAGAEHLRRTALSGKPDQRRLALQLLWDTAPDHAQRELARSTAGADRAASVRAVADGFIGEREADAVPVPEVATPPVNWAVEWTDELAQAVADMEPTGRGWRAVGTPAVPYPPPIDKETGIELLRQLLTSPDAVRDAVFDEPYLFRRAGPGLSAVERGVVTAEAAVKLLCASRMLKQSSPSRYGLGEVAELLHRHQGVTLLELGALLDDAEGAAGIEMLAEGWFDDSPEGLARDWAPDTVWPFFAAHLDTVLDYWSKRRRGHSYAFDSARIFPLVATFPETPTRLVELCYDLALGGARRDQRAAQDFLSSHPDAVRRATAALAEGDGSVRAVAADWLGRLGDRGAVPALASAFAHERNDAVRGTMLESLVALGETVETHFDLADSDAQAARVVAKGLPAALKWLDPGRLPEVRRSHGTVVPRETMLWLIVGATKAKSSIPTALLEACVGQLRPEEAQAFGDALLALWIEADEAAVGRHSYQQVGYGQRASSAGQPSGARGLFAVVAACGGAASVTAASRYLRTWHGQRAHQSKALVTMLAHHRHPAAAEALVAIAYRFKAPSIERQARTEVEELAERRGWTRDQLADRTVPTAGFDDQGTLHLSYGERSFTARLLPGCSIELVDADGKVLKALPSPRRGEEEAAKEAKRALSAARKQLTETVKLQTLRLHDAMCVQRAWTGSEWREDIAGHPVLARLAARLVWVAQDGDQRLTFRLLDDGTLTTAGDDPVDLGDDAEVRIAHDVVLAEDEVESWQQHLDDYEVGSLFAQLGRGRPELTPDEAAADTLDAHRLRVPIGRLEQAAARRGYRRGAVGDAAAFDWFEKEFASLGLRSRAMIEGHAIEDHESDTVLEGLVVESSTTGLPVPLGQVPPVLLAELRHDLSAMVAQGTASGTAKG